MEYLFVDLENIALKTVSELPPGEMVYVFAGEKQTKMSTDLVLSMMARGAHSRLIQTRGDGKNALDFHIAYYLGKLSEADKQGSFRILSKDKGFDALVRHLKDSGVECARIEKIPARKPPKSTPKELLEAFVAHLNGMAVKTRPKKASKLKAYLKNWGHLDDLMVEPLFSGLLIGKQIELDGEKIKYTGSPEG